MTMFTSQSDCIRGSGPNISATYVRHCQLFQVVLVFVLLSVEIYSCRQTSQKLVVGVSKSPHRLFGTLYLSIYTCLLSAVNYSDVGLKTHLFQEAYKLTLTSENY